MAAPRRPPAGASGAGMLQNRLSKGRVPKPPSATGFRMDRKLILDILRANEAALRDRGVVHVALFGSAARGEAGPASDIDLMIEIDPAAPVGVWELAAIREAIAALFPAPVDVVERDRLRPHVRPAAERDALHAF